MNDNLAFNDVAVDVQALRVDLPDGNDVVSDVSFSIRPGRVLGLVGESGSGKTTVGMALLGYARGGAQISRGVVRLGGESGIDILSLDEAGLQQLRGKAIAYVPQDPAAALNPSLRIRTQLAEVIWAHEPHASDAGVLARIVAAIKDVGLPTDDAFLNRYPHQLSGGQQQRIVIAMAVIMLPRLIVLDEPTTGLDVTTQNRILDIVRRLCSEHGIAALHVTHDLSVIAHIADDVMVMYGGRVIELGPVEAVLTRPEHPYTQALLGAVPELRHRTLLTTIVGRAPNPTARPVGCYFNPRCSIADDGCRSGSVPLEHVTPTHQVRCWKHSQVAATRPEPLADPDPVAAADILAVKDMHVAYGVVTVLDGVSFAVRQGECLAIVGESGSGKSTLSRALIGLVPQQTSQVWLQGELLSPMARRRTRKHRQSLQYIFQSPHTSLNPRHTVQELVGLAYDLFKRRSGIGRDEAVIGVLQQVGLSPELRFAYPDQLSGGERQRVAIARALMADPDILVCDEITSALDVSVQAAVVNLLKDLQQTRKLTLLFVTHNLALVRNLADRVLVLDKGKVVEVGSVGQVIDHPSAPYTRQLLGNALEADIETRGNKLAHVPAQELPAVSRLGAT